MPGRGPNHLSPACQMEESAADALLSLAGSPYELALSNGPVSRAPPDTLVTAFVFPHFDPDRDLPWSPDTKATRESFGWAVAQICDYQIGPQYVPELLFNARGKSVILLLAAPSRDYAVTEATTGLALLERKNANAELHLLCSCHDAGGLGTFLLGAAERLARDEWGVQNVELTSVEEAHAFYAHRGYLYQLANDGVRFLSTVLNPAQWFRGGYRMVHELRQRALR